MGFEIIFDEVILKQLKKAGKTKKIRGILTKMMDKIELLGPEAGKLLDSKLHLYEIKNENPSIRLYFKPYNNKVFLFEFEIKKGEEKQKRTIDKLRKKIRNLGLSLYKFLFVYSAQIQAGVYRVYYF